MINAVSEFLRHNYTMGFFDRNRDELAAKGFDASRLPPDHVELRPFSHAMNICFNFCRRQCSQFVERQSKRLVD